MNTNDGATISTLPVLTKCRFNEMHQIEMVVVIRDVRGVFKTDFDDANDVLTVKYGVPGAKLNSCFITQMDNALEYFRV